MTLIPVRNADGVIAHIPARGLHLWPGWTPVVDPVEAAADTRTIDQILAAVGHDPVLAQRALDAEQTRPSPTIRKTLIANLTHIIATMTDEES